MTVDAWITIGVLISLLGALALELFSVDFLMLTGLIFLVLIGVVDLDVALEGFANSTLLALGSLYVVAAGLRQAGALDAAAHLILGEERNLRKALARLSATVSTSSAFLNNTPIVAMGIPAVRNWARDSGIAPSKLLIPLSYASILGGICTLIGTSTNLVTHGLLQSHGLEGLGFFELARVGVPCALVGFVYLVFVAPALLPEREAVQSAEERERERQMELEVGEDSPVAGETVKDSGVDSLSGHALVRLERGGEAYGPVGSDEELSEGDVLAYERLDGEGETSEGEQAALATEAGLEAHGPTGEERRPPEKGPVERHEAVVKEGSGLVGKPLEELDLAGRFGATVTGVRRGGRRVREPLGEIQLRPGDVLLMETGRGFRHAFEGAPEFFITSEEGAAGEREADMAREAETPGMLLAGAILASVVGLAALGVTHIAVAGTLGAFAMVVFGYLTPGEAREAVDWSILVVIGSALGLGRAMETTGAAEWMGHWLVEGLAGFGPILLLVGVYAATVVMTELITNNGAAALLFPVALSVAQGQGLDPRPFMIGITVAASTSMLTPIGYQTNLMVYGAGNYHFTDFTRVGGLLQLLVAVVAVTLIPRIWGF